jgi:hypothetical protein
MTAFKSFHVTGTVEFPIDITINIDPLDAMRFEGAQGFVEYIETEARRIIQAEAGLRFDIKDMNWSVA